MLRVKWLEISESSSDPRYRNSESARISCHTHFLLATEQRSTERRTVHSGLPLIRRDQRFSLLYGARVNLGRSLGVESGLGAPSLASAIAGKLR